MCTRMNFVCARVCACVYVHAHARVFGSMCAQRHIHKFYIYIMHTHMCIDAFDTNTYIQTYFPPTDDQLFCRLLAQAHKSTSTSAVKDRIRWVSPNVLRHHSLSLPPITGQDKLSCSVAEHSSESEKREIIDHNKLPNEVMKVYRLWHQQPQVESSKGIRAISTPHNRICSVNSRHPS